MDFSRLLDDLTHDIGSMNAIDKLMGGFVVTLLCMMIVFMVLILLMYSVKALRVFAFSGGKQSGEGAYSAQALPRFETVAKTNGTIGSENDSKDDSEDDTEEIAAVIMAVLCSATSSSPTNLVVRKITRIPDMTTNWSRNSLHDDM